MKIYTTMSRLGLKLLVMGCCLLWSLSASAQLSIGSDGLSIKAGAQLSVDGLALFPEVPVQFSSTVLKRSTTAVTYNGMPSIQQVYALTTPITFQGTLRLRYEASVLNGIDADELTLIYASTTDGAWVPLPGSVVNPTDGFVEYEFDEAVNIQRITAASANSAPAFSNLNGDQVAWPGVGNSVVLDAGGNATVLDGELDASNWGGASLTVQRAGTPLDADTYGFNPTGFTVSGNNLQDGNTTFGTFTSVNGVLTIIFNTNATNTLVRNVVNSIQYRNDTPAGDATIRFTLSDGKLNAMADVTVTSDVIYVNNPNDTGTINLADGVSLSEAVAIAAADVTGNQTLVFTSDLASQTINLAGNLSIKESLMIDAGAASGIAIGGSTITLDAGTTLRFTNGTGDVAFINSEITGPGGLGKSGSGFLTLGSNTNIQGWSGTIAVTGGTLDIQSPSQLSTGTLTLDGGTLHLLVPGNISVANNLILGDNTAIVSVYDTTNNKSEVNFTGTISGGNLIKRSNATLVLSGNNSYDTTIVLEGALQVETDANLGGGEVILLAETMLSVTGQTTINNPIVLERSAMINTSDHVTLSGVISGSGGFTKVGTSTLTLSGSNTYNGATTVFVGGLVLEGGSSIGDNSAVTVANGTTLTLAGGRETIGSLAGFGSVVLGPYNLITGGNNSSTTFSGVISGTGSGIAKTGSGTFTLSGTNTYTGSTTVSAGTLALGGGAAINDASAVTVASGATLFLNASETIASLAGAGNVSLNGFTLSSGGNNTSTTFSGALGGSGDFTKTGSGTLILSGSNSGTFTGGTTVSGGGTLSVASDDNLGSGTLSINNSTFGITGATTIDNSITLTNSATISNTSAVTLSGAISGSGSLSKAGSGVLSLSGTSNYDGSTTVLADTLSVTGALNGTSAVSVSSGATLTGSGSVTNLIVSSGGTLSPGNSSGVFTVNGNLKMNSGSTLAVEINGVTAGTDYDQVIVNGMVSIAGNLVASHGYSAGQGDNYTIIVNDMADLFIGTFSGLAEGATITAGGNSSVLTASYIGGTGNDFTLTAPINAAPVIGNLGGDNVSFIEDSALVLLDAGSDATLTDDDSVDLDGGNVTVSIVANRMSTEDVLSIRNQGTSAGQIGISGLTITYGGSVIGTSTANGGTDVHDLVISLNGNATPAIVQALIRNLIYTNTNTTVPNTNTRSVRVTVNDGDGGTSSNADISVAVVAINDAPTLTAIGGTPTFTEGGSAVSLFSAVSINTVEAGELIKTLVFTITNVTNGSSEVITVDGSGIPLTNGFSTTTVNNTMNVSVAVVGTTATLTLSKEVGISVVAAQTLVDAMIYSNSSENPGVANRVVTITSIQDTGGTANGGTDTAAISIAATITISAVNDGPTISGTPATAVNQDALYSFTPVVKDIDGDALTYSIVNKPNWATFDETTGKLSGTPSNSDVGTTTGIVITATDEILSASLPAFDLEVVNVNDEPTISMATAPTHINQGEFYEYTPVVNDPDGDVLLFEGVNLPGWLAIDPLTGRIYGTPGNDDVGTHPFESFILVSDDDGVTWIWSESDFFFTVVNVNDAPTITGSPATTIKPGETYEFEPSAEDIDGDELTFSILNKPNWASFNTTTGVLTGTPLRNDEGLNSSIVISVSDGTVSIALPAFNIKVEPAPAITDITFDDASFVYDGTAKSLAIGGTLPDGASVSYVANSRTDAGTQTVIATVNGGDQYSDLSLTAELTINKAVIRDITFDDASFIYDGIVQSLAIGGALPDGTSVTYTNNERTDAGKQTVTATIDGGINYEDLVLNAELEITKAIAVITADLFQTHVYDGMVKEVLATLNYGEAVLDYTPQMGYTNVGKYEIEVSAPETKNYFMAAETIILEIAPAVMGDLVFEDKNVVYNGEVHALEVAALPLGASVTYSGNEQSEAGVYEVTATIHQGNYQDVVLKATLTIGKASVIITADAVQRYVYDGSVKKVQASLNHGETSLVYSPQHGYSDGGVYKIMISAPETDNYLGGHINVQLIIDQEDLSDLVFKGKAVSYTGEIHRLAIENLPEGWQVSYQGNDQIDAGNYVVTANITRSGYPEKIMTANLIISKASQAISFEEVGTVSRDAGRVALQVSSSSGLPVSLTSDHSFVATVLEQDLLIHRLGTVRITASQEGDKNHEAAEPVSITVRVEDEEEGPVKVSKAMSPNGDGINDGLILEGIADYPENHLQILSRNGLLLFDVEGYDNETNVFSGVSNTRFSTDTLPEGTYFYVLKFRAGGKWETKKGWFVLKTRY